MGTLACRSHLSCEDHDVVGARSVLLPVSYGKKRYSSTFEWMHAGKYARFMP